MEFENIMKPTKDTNGGIYIHIPFCKKACHYCDFHFSTSLKKKTELIDALCKEIYLRKAEFKNTTVNTIYFGGGTPSLLDNAELHKIIESIYLNYTIAKDPEITLEANPDDLTLNKIKALSNSPVNRLSIGVQSFFEADLKLMNRAHNSNEALQSVKDAVKYFNNVTLDLIYGVPNATDEQWISNIKEAIQLGVPHISSYALTVEPKTALETFISKGVIPEVDDEQAQRQFYILKELLEAEGFVHYELSNFGKEGFFSRNNTAYWQGKSYLGIGPSAHSFNGEQRGWNVRNNSKYIKSIQTEKLPIEIESLTKKDRYNEYVMTGLRTMYGVDINKIKDEFGEGFEKYIRQQSKTFITQRLLKLENNTLTTTKEGQFLSDGISSDLFMLNL